MKNGIVSLVVSSRDSFDSPVRAAVVACVAVLAVLGAGGCGAGGAGGTADEPAPDGGPDADAAQTPDADQQTPDGGGEDGDADRDDSAVEECPEQGLGALTFDGVDDHVTMGLAPALGLAVFTLEAWVRWDGNGVAAGSGVGGVRAIPIIAKGRGEHDGDTVDCNYLFGIDEATRALAADFEDLASGANHPVVGRTPLEPGVWHHVAVSFDGSAWRLYLDGAPDGDLAVGATPRHDSVQHFGLGTAIDSTGAPAGAFGGALDEVRVWDRARTPAEIAEGLALTLESGEGLVARWALDETAGAVATDTLGRHPGSVVGATWLAPGAPFLSVAPPSLTPIAPVDGATVSPAGVGLAVWADDLGSRPLTIEFLGRQVDPDFSVVVLPDTQYYARDNPAMFVEHTRWVRTHAAEYNVRAVLHAGDITDNGQVEAQWINADRGMSELEVEGPGYPDGLPYGIAVGNHDQRGGTTRLYNQYFGEPRFAVRPWYGGHYGADNDNHYILFDAGATRYVALFLEYDESADADVLAWARGVLLAHPDHRALVTLHWLIGRGNPGAWSAQGLATYEALRDITTIDLMLCGHIGGEGRRTDTYDGHDIHTLLADYQFIEDGESGHLGDGWLRILLFAPASGTVHVRTWSTRYERWDTDADSDFVLSYDSPAPPYAPIGERVVVSPGSNAIAIWDDLEPGSAYQWYATVESCWYERSSDPRTFGTL